jgi:hypothetical protein
LWSDFRKLTWENTWVKKENGIDKSLETTDVPTKQEVTTAISKLKKNKAPGPDGITSEILKEGYECMEHRIYG